MNDFWDLCNFLEQNLNLDLNKNYDTDNSIKLFNCNFCLDQKKIVSWKPVGNMDTYLCEDCWDKVENILSKNIL